MATVKKNKIVDSQGVDVSYDVGALAQNVVYDGNSSVKDKIDDYEDIIPSSASSSNKLLTEEDLPVATDEQIGLVKPDGTTITIDENGTLTAIGGGGSVSTRDYTYTGAIQTFTAPETGIYTLEVQGGQGGTPVGEVHGGYGGYSVGKINLNQDDTIYICVGGEGGNSSSDPAAYNGGGLAYFGNMRGNGGGATHIATATGELTDLASNQSAVIIVAGGGGGAGNYAGTDQGDGGSGGGYIGGHGLFVGSTTGDDNSHTGSGGTQSVGGETENYSTQSAGSFGQGANRDDDSLWGGSGGGGGQYGGGASTNNAGAGGGSGYLNTSVLTDACMYGYNVQESSDTATKTIATLGYNSVPTPGMAKAGNGYARISWTKAEESYTAGAGISITDNVIVNTRKGALSGVIDEVTSSGTAHTQINNALNSVTAGGLVVLKAEASGTANTVRIQYGEQASQSQDFRLCDTDSEYITPNVSMGDTMILMFDTTGYKLIVLSILNNSGGSGGDSYAGLGIGKMTSFTNNVIDTDIDLHRALIEGDRLLVYISESVSNPSSIKTYNNGVAVTTNITFGQTYPVGLAIFRYTPLGWQCLQMIAYSAGTGISITGTTISNSAPQLGMNIGYGEVTSVTDGNIGQFNGNADYLDINFKVNASPYNGGYTMYLAMGGSTVIMKYATLKDRYGYAYNRDIQQGTILHCLSKVSGTGTAQDPIVVKVIDENVIANPTGTPNYNLEKIRVGGYIYDASSIKPYEAYSISNGGISIHTADPNTYDGQIIAVNTGANSGTTTDAWYLNLVGNGSSYPIEMTNADGTGFKDALSENELLFVYVDTHNPPKAILLKTAGASGSGGASALSDLTDVDITSPTDGQVLIYNGTTGRWENKPKEVYFEQSVTLSTSTTTTVTFTDAKILATSFIDPAISVWGIFPEDVTVASGSCTVVMPKVSTAQTVTVGIFIKR